jgi:peptidoglycan/xylan/chitin deacetylase (PgdA/CDA1 family)
MHNENICKIMMLHRVHPFEENKLLANENMKITPEFLENFLVDAKNKGYEFISLDELYDIFISKRIVENKVIITLDDGYKDNYTYAYHILKKHDIPFAIYLTTNFPEYKAILWWYGIEDLIICNNKIILSNGEEFDCTTIELKNEVFLKIRLMVMKLNQNNLENELNELFKLYEINWQEYVKELALTWDNIIELSKDPLCTIAGHTINHYVLSKIDQDLIKNEISLGNIKISEIIKKEVNHFAYPFGDEISCNLREFEVARTCNLKTATTTINGHVRFSEDLMSLRRIMLIEEEYLENPIR